MQLLHRCVEGIHRFDVFLDCCVGIYFQNFHLAIKKQLSFGVIAKSVEGIAAHRYIVLRYLG